MSKTTKIIAALGVVAGLGVAALPAFTYAAQTQQSVSGSVDLYAEVQPAIAMTISGNNDDNSNYGTQADPSAEPAVEGDNATVHVKNPSGATTISGQDVSSFEVGVATKASSSYLSILPSATGTMTSTVTVYTNNASGYSLKVKDADETTALTKDGSSATIPASATTTAGTAGWSIAGGTLAASAITAADQSVKTTATKTTGGDATTMTYTVATAADQETGIYTDTIVYTATTNN